MTPQHSEAFIDQAVIKLLSRGERSIISVAQELNVNYHTAKYWLKRALLRQSPTATTHEKRPQDWSAHEQFLALQETYGLSSEALQTWCRERGLFAHHLTAWKTAFCTPQNTSTGALELRTLKAENDQLKRDLLRKEKALAEAAALLILQKKFRALWEDEAK